MFLRLNLLFEKKNKTKKDKDKESEKKDKSKKVFKFGGVKEEVIPHMPEEKKEAEIIRKKSQSKTPDIKLVEEKSEDEGEFKIQIIRRHNNNGNGQVDDVPESKDLNENNEKHESHQPHENSENEYDYQDNKKLSEKDFENLDQADIEKIQMQVCF